MVIVGAVAFVAGLTIALHYKTGIGACDASGVCKQQDGKMPAFLGVATAGAAMSMVGACLWMTIPSTNTNVGIGPSSLVLAGRF